MRAVSGNIGARAIACVLCIAILLQGCATGGISGRSPGETFALGQQMLAQGKIDEGISLLAEAVRQDPKRLEYQIYLANQREAITAALAGDADRYRAVGDYASAEAIYQQMLRQDW